MPKKITKTVKTPAPATKTAAPAAAPAPAPAKKSTVAPKIKVAATPATPAPAVVAKPKGGRVTIIATVDVGFGNVLFLRGDEPVLRWDKGIALGNVDGGKWEIVLTAVTAPFQFKFLVNDSGWSSGDNFTASPGDTVTITPAF
jgi:hypothetical protein